MYAYVYVYVYLNPPPLPQTQLRTPCTPPPTHVNNLGCFLLPGRVLFKGAGKNHEKPLQKETQITP